MRSAITFTIARDEGGMTVFPDHPIVRDFLTLQYREMIKEGRRTRFETLRAPMFQVTSVRGQAALFSHQGFWKSLSDELEKQGFSVSVQDMRPQVLAPPNYAAALQGLREYQKPWILTALKNGNSGLIGAPTRYGKCLSPSTPVMRSDGSVVPARAVNPGDQLMGPDSAPREVLSCICGREEMFRITPNKGDAFECTGDHYLVVKRTQDGTKRAGEEIAITVVDYLQKSEWFKHTHKLVHAATDFPEVPTSVDPYCYGMWLGDGHSDKPALTSDDPPLVDIWAAEASRCGLRIAHNDLHRNDTTKTVIMRKLHGTDTRGIPRADRGNVWMDQVHKSTPGGIKRISREFLINSREVRLEVLAGIIDTDGYVNNGKAYSVVWKHLETARDLVSLGRSLGFRCTLHSKERSAHPGHKATYYEVHITGSIDLIPVILERKKIQGLNERANPLMTGFSVESVGEGDYYGFELSGDRKFLLGSFLVTHNSYGMTAIARAFPGARIVVTAPGVDLCRQLLEHFKETLPHRDVKGVFSGSRNSKQSDDITICSIDSLDKMDPDDTDILILDEPHAVVSEERKPKVEKFVRARKYGFGATLNGRFDKKDRLIEGLIGPIISNVTYLEGVEQGAIAPLKVLFVKLPFSQDTIPGRYADRDIVYQRLLTQSTRTAALVRKIIHDVIPEHWQTMAFIQNEKQALFYLRNAIITAGEMVEVDEKFGEYQQKKEAERADWRTAVKAWEEKGGEGDKPDEPDPALTLEGFIEKWARDRRGTIAMAKRMKTSQRKLITQGIVDNEIWRVLASNIYVQGLTFPDLKVVLNLAGGGANTTAIQKPGRLLQTRPRKNYGVMIDFVFDCKDKEMETRPNPPYSGVVGECWARHKAYKEIGYDIEFVEDSERAREVILGAYESDDPTTTSAGSRVTQEP